MSKIQMQMICDKFVLFEKKNNCIPIAWTGYTSQTAKPFLRY